MRLRNTATEEFDALCFDFGIELDEDTTEEVMAARKKGGKEAAEAGEPELKIELPANRYDLLCLEGLARGLRQFLGKENPPAFKLSNPANMIECTVEDSVSSRSGGITTVVGASVANILLASSRAGVFDPALLRFCRSPTRQADEPGSIRLFHRFARQTSPKPVPRTKVGRHRYPRLGHNQGSLQASLAGVISD